MVGHLFLEFAVIVTMSTEVLGPAAPPFAINSRTVTSPFQGRNTISGLVFGSSRQPVAQVYVELMNDVDSVIAMTRTTGAGRYVFENLSQGTYQVRVLTHGTNYVSQTKRVNIVNFITNVPSLGTVTSGTEYVQLDFSLQTAEAHISAGVPGTIFVQEIPSEARSVYEKAVAYLDSGQNELGLAGLKSAIEIFPNYYQALERLGTEYVKQRHYHAAAILLSKAIEANPRGHASLFALGISQYHLKLMSSATETFRRAASLAPNSIFSHLWLGTVLRQTGKLDQSETPLKRAKQLGKNQIPEAHWQLALLYNQLKRYREAAVELELFLKAEPHARDAEQIKKLIRQLREKSA